MEIKNGNELKKAMDWVVDDYNNRPHVSLDGLSPNEKYLNLSVDKACLARNSQKAREERIKYNMEHRCGTC